MSADIRCHCYATAADRRLRQIEAVMLSTRGACICLWACEIVFLRTGVYLL